MTKQEVGRRSYARTRNGQFPLTDDVAAGANRRATGPCIPLACVQVHDGHS